jgi:guanylate kinase
MKTNMILVAAPSGAGKSSFVEKAILEVPQLVDIVTCTTRAMRTGESPGKPYHFFSKDDFEERMRGEYFVEWAHVHGNLYGTPRDQIDEAWGAQKAVIMDIDIQGVDTIHAKFPHARTIFILPPSLDVLRQRLIKRDGQEPPQLQIRLANAAVELKRACDFDYVLVNDRFESSYRRFKKIIEDLLR